MLRNNISASVITALVLGLIPAGCITGEDGADLDPVAEGSGKLPESEGEWHRVSQGVWELTRDDGTIRRRAQGQEGLSWMLPEFERANDELRHAYTINPTSEIAEQIANHDAFLEELRQRLANPQDTRDAPDAFKASCDRSLGIDANAGQGNPGANASADADWSASGTCSNTTATLYAYAYVS